MTNNTNQSSSLADIGQKLLDHSKLAEFSARRGAVVELFPYIFAANERLSARAIGRFLEKEQGVKLSPVTITKALNDPKKSWNAFYDLIEPYALIFQKETGTPLDDLLFKDKTIKNSSNLALRVTKKLVFSTAFDQADLVLRDKWFSIDLAIRQKARPYLAERLLKKV